MSKKVIFDPSNQLLEIGGVRAQISPKAFSVLTYLYEHQQQLVTKDDLLNAIWAKVFVTDAVLKVAVGELRKALNDHPKQPRFIETVHRRGYRFIGEMVLVNKASSNPAIKQQTAIFVGRKNALGTLDVTWAEAQAGNKQLLFVCAEAGVGKSALINSWLDQQFIHSENPSNGLLATAACFDQYGSSEPYLPVLSALGMMLKSPQSSLVKKLLRQFAPSWFLQIPSLVQVEKQSELHQELFGVTNQRMLREFVDFIDALSDKVPVLLCIEDLHWCDAASLDLIVALAQRQNSARFMLLSSFRESALQWENSPLKVVYSQLMMHQQCRSLTLSALDKHAVAEWLQLRLPAALQSDVYTDIFCRYTEGSPLLMSTALDYLQQSGVLAQTSDADDETNNADHARLDASVPSKADAISPEMIEQGISGGLKRLLGLKTAQLSKEDRQLLEVASVSAAEFATESLAAVLQKDVLAIEEACEDTLLHEQWLAPLGSQNWPDGSISERYRFWHQLTRQFFYETLSAARCRHYHLRFAERLLSGYQDKSNQIASELAYHFEAGGNLPQAIAFSQQASAQSAQCFAYREAIIHTDKVIELSEQLEDFDTHLEARKKRCGFLLAGGQLAETITEYQALIQSCQRLEDIPSEIDATLGLGDALFWVDRQGCLEAGERAVALSLQTADAAIQIHAQGKYVHYCSVVNGYQTQYAQAYEAALQLAQSSDDETLQCVHYPRHLYYLIIRSEYPQASALAKTAMQLALDNGDAASYLSCEFFHAWALFYEGKWGEMLSVIQAALALAKKNEHRPWVLHFTLQKSWLLLQLGDYAGSRALCLPIYEQASGMGSGSLYYFSLIILLQLETASGQVVSQDYVTAVTAKLADTPMAIDWVLRFPLQQGLAEFYLQQQQWDQATRAAEELLALAMCSGEQTYWVMAEYFQARCALGRDNKQEAQVHLEQASKILTQHHLPVMEWRLLALQNKLEGSKAAIQTLLEGLTAEPELYVYFEQSAAIQARSHKAVCRDS